MRESPSGRDDTERLRALRAERRRLDAELRAVEDGTLPFVEDRRHVTADVFAQAFGLTLPAANNRLVKLVEVGLLEREPIINGKVGGRSFRYRKVRDA